MQKIKELKQESLETFSITWSDGEKLLYRLSDVQRACPCSGCEEKTKETKLDAAVQALSITSVGSYAIKIQFSSGCSFGVYTFALLKQLGRSVRGYYEKKS